MWYEVGKPEPRQKYPVINKSLVQKEQHIIELIA